MADKIVGIDVHKKVLMVVAMDARAPELKPELRRFTTMPSELRRLSTWLREEGVKVKEAVMESTAQYWRSVCWNWSRICACTWRRHFPTGGTSRKGNLCTLRRAGDL